MKKRILAIILAFSLLACAVPQLVLPANAAENSVNIQDPLRYGWQILQQMDNAESLLFAYENLVIGITNCEEIINVYDTTHSITSDELLIVMEAIHNDYPEFFWLDISYRQSASGGKIRKVAPNYTMTGTTLNRAKASLAANTRLLLTGLEDKSDFEISRLLHDRLAAFMTYQPSGNDQNIYGALVERKAVCAGYASAYQYLMQQAGIPALKVAGSSLNPSTGTYASHAWTLVKLDGSWYHADATWDDQGNLGNIYYGYLNITTKQILEDHIIDPLFASYLPECTATANNYFTKNGGRVSSFDLNATVSALKANNLQARFYVTGDMNAFQKAWNANISTVVSQLDIYGTVTYGYRVLGREIVLYIRVADTAPAPTAISLISLPKNTAWEGTPDVTGCMANIHYNDGSVEAMTVTSDMISDFDPKVSGTQVVTVTVQGCEEYFTIYNTAAPEPEALPGDLDGDDAVSNNDVITLLWHCLFPETNPISANADFTGDNAISNDDVIKLLWHCLFPEENPL